jgi:4-aminobutyrate aminotransferase
LILNPRGPETSEIIQEELVSALDHITPVWGRIFSVMVDHGQGAYLFDVEGKRYLDFTCGIGVTNTGHSHP